MTRTRLLGLTLSAAVLAGLATFATATAASAVPEPEPVIVCVRWPCQPGEIDSTGS